MLSLIILETPLFVKDLFFVRNTIFSELIFQLDIERFGLRQLVLDLSKIFFVTLSLCLSF